VSFVEVLHAADVPGGVVNIPYPRHAGSEDDLAPHRVLTRAGWIEFDRLLFPKADVQTAGKMLY
jgi:hypothetical protein